MARKTKVPETGIEIWDGVPGSGKSYGAVDRLIREIIDFRRPVYTNLPIRLRVLRRYLIAKTGKELYARYIHVLTRDHMERFVERNQELTDYAEMRNAEGISRAVAEREYCEAEGPHITTGPDANWIPAGAVIIGDEWHRWQEQENQKNLSPAWKTYVTMHRHHLHLIMVLTQDKMQVSLPWRRNAVKVVHCSDKRKLPFMFGLSLPFPAFAYEHWPVEYADSKDHGMMKPMQVNVRFPAFSGGVIWRLYDSFTHMGSYSSLTRKLEEVRKAVEGEYYTKSPEKEQKEVSVKRIKKLRAPIIAAVLVAMMFILLPKVPGCSRPQVRGDLPEGVQQEQQSTAEERVEQYQQRMAEQNQPAEVDAGEDQQELGRASTPRVTVIGDGYVVADGRRLKTGAQVDGWTLRGTDVLGGEAGWAHDDGTFVLVGLERLPDQGAGPGRVSGTLRDRLQRAREDAGESGDGEDGSIR